MPYDARKQRVRFDMQQVDYEWFQKLAADNGTSIQDCVQFVFESLAEGCRRLNYKTDAHAVIKHYELYARNLRHAQGPTNEGKKRYPDTAGHFNEIPCICTPDCGRPCSGGCGCLACDTRGWDEYRKAL